RARPEPVRRRGEHDGQHRPARDDVRRAEQPGGPTAREDPEGGPVPDDGEPGYLQPVQRGRGAHAEQRLRELAAAAERPHPALGESRSASRLLIRGTTFTNLWK